ncbi:MAG: hypothetical protein ACO292_02410, partial [Ilumatobacteraceae bacterium]
RRQKLPTPDQGGSAMGSAATLERAVPADVTYGLSDADQHYYEAHDAVTRHLHASTVTRSTGSRSTVARRFS